MSINNAYNSTKAATKDANPDHIPAAFRSLGDGCSYCGGDREPEPFGEVGWPACGDCFLDDDMRQIVAQGAMRRTR